MAIPNTLRRGAWLQQVFEGIEDTNMTKTLLYVLEEPDDATKARVDVEETALRINLTQSLVARKEQITQHALLNCSCRSIGGSSAHYASYEHVNAAIYYQTYALQGRSMSPSRQVIIDALRPRARVIGADVLEALDAIVESRDENFMAIAMRFVAQASLASKGALL